MVHYPCLNGYDDLFFELLRRKADLDGRNAVSGTNALEDAVFREDGSPRILGALLEIHPHQVHHRLETHGPVGAFLRSQMEKVRLEGVERASRPMKVMAFCVGASALHL